MMNRAAMIVLIVGSVAGASVAHAALHPRTIPAAHARTAPAVQLYHQESSIRAIHVNGGYRIVSSTAHHGAS